MTTGDFETGGGLITGLTTVDGEVFAVVVDGLNIPPNALLNSSTLRCCSALRASVTSAGTLVFGAVTGAFGFDACWYQGYFNYNKS